MLRLHVIFFVMDVIGDFIINSCSINSSAHGSRLSSHTRSSSVDSSSADRVEVVVLIGVIQL